MRKMNLANVCMGWVYYSTSDTERINEVVLYPFHAVEHGDETNLAGLLSFPYYGLSSKSV